MNTAAINEILWNTDRPLSDFDSTPEVPVWIDDYLTPCDVAAVNQGGCASGAYMPAVNWEARETMNRHGSEILDYIGLPRTHFDDGQEWSELACSIVSFGVEVWCSRNAEPIAQAIADETEYPEHNIEGTPLFYVDSNGEPLCAGCMAESVLGGWDDPDAVSPVCHWEGDPIECSGCAIEIASLYGPTD